MRTNLTWKDWKPGRCPVKPDTRVALRFKDFRETVTDRPQDLRIWDTDQIRSWALAPHDTLAGGRKPRRHEFRAPTTDDWCPTRADGTVTVSAVELVGGNGTVGHTRVCVWGDDDLGMECDFDIDVVNFEMACIIADNLPRPITFEALVKLGFTRA